MPEEEGVVKYKLHHTHEAPYICSIPVFNQWRQIFYNLGLIGKDHGRYGGKGYGNLSIRLGTADMSLGERIFRTTGTQTSGLEKMCLRIN